MPSTGALPRLNHEAHHELNLSSDLKRKEWCG